MRSEFLPGSDERSDWAKDRGPSPAALPSGSPFVHVVDDDAALRTALKRLLGAAGYQVRPANSCSAAPR